MHKFTYFQEDYRKTEFVKREDLFMTEGNQGIGVSGAPCGKKASGQARGYDDGHDGSECGRVSGGNAGDLAGEQASESITCKKAKENASDHQTEAVEQH